MTTSKATASGSRAPRGPIFAARVAALACAAAFGCGDDAMSGPDADAGTEAGYHDELSAPAKPTVSVDSFSSAKSCATCHPRHYEQWKTSMHAYSMVDPVFRALVRERQRAFGGEQDKFCTQCHTAIGTRGGDIEAGFAFEELSELSLEGITCESCHRVSDVRRTHNSGHVLAPDGPVRSTIEDPVASSAHESEYSPLHGSSEFCAGCHDVLEVNGLNLERPYEEWLESPSREEGEGCQGCHMPTYRAPAATNGPERTCHDHGFVGVDVPLAEGFATPEEVAEIREEVRALLGGAASVELEAPEEIDAGEQLDVIVDVKNNIRGHNLPTGSTFMRQLWLEVIARDAEGDVIYETGTLDANQDLRDHFSELDPYGDDDLIAFHSTLIDETGTPVMFSWNATEHFTNAIPPAHERTFTLFVPTSTDTPGPIEIDARLRFRTHAPYLLRRLGLERLVDDIEIYDLASDEIAVPADAP